MSEVKLNRPEAEAALSIEPWKDDVAFFAFNPVEAIMSQEDGNLFFPSCRNAGHAGKRSGRCLAHLATPSSSATA